MESLALWNLPKRTLASQLHHQGQQQQRAWSTTSLAKKYSIPDVNSSALKAKPSSSVPTHPSTPLTTTLRLLLPSPSTAIPLVKRTLPPPPTPLHKPTPTAHTPLHPQLGPPPSHLTPSHPSTPALSTPCPSNAATGTASAAGSA